MRFGRPKSNEPEINLIPFIDVLLVVLIFLMLTTTYGRLTQLDLRLPQADTAPQQERPREIRINVSMHCERPAGYTELPRCNGSEERERGVLHVQRAATQRYLTVNGEAVVSSFHTEWGETTAPCDRPRCKGTALEDHACIRADGKQSRQDIVSISVHQNRRVALKKHRVVQDDIV